MARYACLLAALLLPGMASATMSFSFTGTLTSPDDDTQTDFFLANLTLVTGGTITLQTYGFGGGTNAAGAVIPSGGFDPFIGLYDSTGTLIDGQSDLFVDFPSYQGCPPAGTVLVGSNQFCGDVAESFNVAAGTYTVLLSDAAYYPIDGMLDLPFFDLTGGVFQTCDNDSNCISDTGDWALDITAPDGSTVPEPGPFGLVGLGVGWAIFRKRRGEIRS